MLVSLAQFERITTRLAVGLGSTPDVRRAKAIKYAASFYASRCHGRMRLTGAVGCWANVFSGTNASVLKAGDLAECAPHVFKAFATRGHDAGDVKHSPGGGGADPLLNPSRQSAVALSLGGSSARRGLDI